MQRPTLSPLMAIQNLRMTLNSPWLKLFSWLLKPIGLNIKTCCFLIVIFWCQSQKVILSFSKVFYVNVIKIINLCCKASLGKHMPGKKSECMHYVTTQPEKGKI